MRFAVARTPAVGTYEDRVLTELEVEVLALAGDGAGEVTVQLDRPWPIRFERDQRLSKHTRTQVGLRGASGGVVMADGGEARIELHTLASVAAAEPETIADVSPRTDGAYCSNDLILACERFLPDGRWMWAVEDADFDDRRPPARTPTDLVWPASATVWRWSGWGPTIYLLHFESIATIATLSADATRLELRDPGDKKVRRRRFMPATLPPVP